MSRFIGNETGVVKGRVVLKKATGLDIATVIHQAIVHLGQRPEIFINGQNVKFEVKGVGNNPLLEEIKTKLGSCSAIQRYDVTYSPA